MSDVDTVAVNVSLVYADESIVTEFTTGAVFPMVTDAVAEPVNEPSDAVTPQVTVSL